MSTKKLYWDDPFTTTFTSEGPALASSFQGKTSIVLPATVFYPEAGGQMADTGTLSAGEVAIAIADVQIADDGTIHHLLAADAPATSVDDLVRAAAAEGGLRGAIDPARRRDHMAQHTAQHMLSQALVDVAAAETVSARLGASACTIDLDLDPSKLGDAALARAEDLVNDVVRGDVTVRALFPTAGELAGMKLRRAPKVTEGVRVIEVEDFDLTPCGGTHCTRTGQIGLVRVEGVERYKGKSRVTFLAARRALDDARAKEKVLGALARELTCGPLDVPAAVAKLRGELKARLDALSAARGELVQLVADQALAAAAPARDGEGAFTLVALARDHDDAAALRALAGRLAGGRADVVALCAAPTPEGDRFVVVQRGAAATSFDCGAWLKAAAQALGGRGGGSKDRAEGRFPNAVTLVELANRVTLPDASAFTHG